MKSLRVWSVVQMRERESQQGLRDSGNWYSSTQTSAWQTAGRGCGQDVLLPSITISLEKTGTQGLLLPLLWFAGIWAASEG